MSKIDDIINKSLSMSDALADATRLMPNSAYAFSVIEKHQEQQRIELAKISEERARQQGKRDEALFQTVQLLNEQIEVLKKQNSLLESQNDFLKEENERQKGEVAKAREEEQMAKQRENRTRKEFWISTGIAAVALIATIIQIFI